MESTARGIAEVIGVIMVLMAVVMATSVMVYYSTNSIGSISSIATTQFARQTDRALESVTFVGSDVTNTATYITVYNSGQGGFYLTSTAVPNMAYTVYVLNGQFVTLSGPPQCTRSAGTSLFGPGDMCVLEFNVSAPGAPFIMETSDGGVFSTITAFT